MAVHKDFNLLDTSLPSREVPTWSLVSLDLLIFFVSFLDLEITIELSILTVSERYSS